MTEPTVRPNLIGRLWEAARARQVTPSIDNTIEAEAKVALEEAVRVIGVAEQLADVASDWNLDEAEIDGEMRDIGDVRDEFRDWLACYATGQQQGGDDDQQ